MDATDDNDEDSGGDTTWSIRDADHFFTSSAWAASSQTSLMIEVKGNTSSHPATGAPTITGTLRVGEELTAGTSAIMDEEGLNNPGYTYQWIRNDGTDDSDISRATSGTYTLVSDDAGHTIKVRVSFTDDAGFEESLTSTATAMIDDPTLLVKNTGQAIEAVSHVLDGTHPRRGQRFTTGQESRGYGLHSIGIEFRDNAPDSSQVATELTVTLNASAGSEPGRVLCTLTNPSAIPDHAVSAFSASGGCPTLKPSTQYFVVIERANLISGSIKPAATASQNEDLGSASNWAIENRLVVYKGSVWLEALSKSHLIEVRGVAVDTPATSATAVATSRTTGKVTIGLQNLTAASTVYLRVSTDGRATWSPAQSVAVAASATEAEFNVTGLKAHRTFTWCRHPWTAHSPWGPHWTPSF